jgi:hypothetical protein
MRPKDATGVCLAVFAADFLIDQVAATQGRPSPNAVAYAARFKIPKNVLRQHYRRFSRTPPGRDAAERAVAILKDKTVKAEMT